MEKKYACELASQVCWFRGYVIGVGATQARSYICYAVGMRACLMVQVSGMGTVLLAFLFFFCSDGYHGW